MVGAHTSYAREAVRGIVEYSQKHCEWDIQYVGVGGDPGVRKAVLEAIRRREVDGLICQFHSLEFANSVIATGIPAIDITGWYQTSLPLVRPDYRAVGKLAARHLIETGFNRFAFLEYSGDVLVTVSDLSLGFAEELQKESQTCHSFRETQEIETWLRAIARPVGILAAGDARSRELVWLCRKLGLRVPQDVAIIGHGNDEFDCSLCNPPLSSVVVPARRVGQRAAAMLDTMLRNKRVPKKSVLLPPLGVAIRQSTDVLAVADPHVSKGVQYIQEHASDGITVTDVARHVSISRRVLEQKFVANLRRTPAAEIRRAQMERAKMLLAETDFKVATVGAKVGIRHYRTFRRLFQQHIGVSPNDYRFQVRH